MASLAALAAETPVGHELAGILFGRATRDGWRVLSAREVPRPDHRRPALPLSNESRRAAQELLTTFSSDLTLREMRPIGWFRSRTRGMASLSPEDVAACHELFSGQPCLALILRPSTQRPVAVSFFWVEAGEIADTSRRGVQLLLTDDINDTATAQPLVESIEEPPPAVAPSGSSATMPPFVAPAREPGATIHRNHWRHRLGRVIPPTLSFLAAVGGALLGAWVWVDRPVDLDATVVLDGSQPVLSVSWNRNVGILSQANGAELQIDKLPVELSETQLRDGSYRIKLPLEMRAVRVRLRIRGPRAEGQQGLVLHVRSRS